jgi:hypothetical protein
MLLLRLKLLLPRHILRMKAPVLRHHLLVRLGDGDPPHDVLVVAPLLARLE